MEHLAPLIQTALWVALVGGIVWRFNKPLEELLKVLQKRINEGGSIKVGSFEMSQLRPQGSASQKEKATQEIQALQ